MTSGATVLADDLGPKGRRLVRIISIISGVAILALVAVALMRLSDKGQLDAAKWKPFRDPDVIEFYLSGLLTTLKVAAVGMSLALVVGGLFALGRLARNRPVRWFSSVYFRVSTCSCSVLCPCCC
jgi:glutamate transport system permease protein